LKQLKSKKHELEQQAKDVEKGLFLLLELKEQQLELDKYTLAYDYLSQLSFIATEV
jgi:hypothetical protein